MDNAGGNEKKAECEEVKHGYPIKLDSIPDGTSQINTFQPRFETFQTLFLAELTPSDVTRMQQPATFLQEVNELGASDDGRSEKGDNKSNLLKENERNSHAGGDREREAGCIM